MLKENYFQPKMLHPTKLLIKCEGRTNTLLNMKNLKKKSKISLSHGKLFQKITNISSTKMEEKIKKEESW